MHAFYGCKSLKTLVIPRNVSEITGNSFWACTGLTEIISHIEQPFTALNIFSYEIYSNATLYVPFGTKGKYMETDGWKNFKTIKEIGELDPIEGEKIVSTDGLGSEDLTDNVVNDVYYNVGSEGYDASDGSIVIGQATNMEQIGDATPGSDDVKNNFTGLILKVAAGQGTITVSAKTTGNAQLVVQVGNHTPTIATKTEKGDVALGYDVAEDTYVYIYAITANSNARSMRAAPAADAAVKIYGITITPGATGIRSIDNGRRTTGHFYMLDGRKVEGQPTKKGLYIVNGRKVVAQ